MNLQPFILAGGNGQRLWPLSSEAKPKQFLKYSNGLSSFQNTVLRNLHFGTPTIIANVNHQEIIDSQLQELNIRAKIIFEPKQRNTAACAIVASYYAKHHGFNKIALIPSDHNIVNQIEYANTLTNAINILNKYKFVTIGISPNCFNSNFGYIRICSEITKDLYHVSKFIEKPMKEFSDNHSYLWNSGIYLYDVDSFLNSAYQFIPEITRNLLQIKYENQQQDKFYIKQKFYANLPFISFDDAISVNLKKLVVVKASFEWNDLGSWEAVYDLDKKDSNHNSITGNISTCNVKNSYINSDAKQTIAIDLDDIIIVFKNSRLFISHKKGAGRIKEILTTFSDNNDQKLV